MPRVVPLLMDHFEEVLEIFRQGISTGMATFETELPGWQKFNSKYLLHSRLVAIINERVVGWAVLSAVSGRECYKGVAEVTLYIHEQHRGRSIGTVLLNSLISESEENGIWSLLSVIHAENNISIRLHERCGFRLVGYRERIAQLNGIWKTTVMMERRSKTVGI